MGLLSYSTLKQVDHRSSKVRTTSFPSDQNSALTLRAGLVGTRRFAAPEILKGEWYDPLYAEVWSLGIVLAILITGDIPFSSEEGAKAGERPLPRTKVHADARDLLGRCLEMEVSKRIRLEEMRHHPWMRSAFA